VEKVLGLDRVLGLSFSKIWQFGKQFFKKWGIWAIHFFHVHIFHHAAMLVKETWGYLRVQNHCSSYTKRYLEFGANWEQLRDRKRQNRVGIQQGLCSLITSTKTMMMLRTVIG
jgi:hypothetical protein